MSTPFSSPKLRDAFAAALFSKELPHAERQIFLIGEGPFEQMEFFDFLNKLEVDADITADIEVKGDFLCAKSPLFVVGQAGWTKQTLDSLIAPADFPEVSFPVHLDQSGSHSIHYLPHRILISKENEGLVIKKSKLCESPRIYSQEILLYHLFTQQDPFDLPLETLLNFADGHPALSYLLEIERFSWVTTLISGESINDLKPLDGVPETGLMKAAGYRVGEHGLSFHDRCRILSEIFTGDSIQKIHSPTYMAEWGSPRSALRLKKMANSIAAFCRNAKRSSVDLTCAIKDWEEDLTWLKQHFYDGVYDHAFKWPFAKR